jgi:hypothetical protein
MNKYILGGMDPGLFMASLLFAMVGVLITLLIGSTMREPDSKFSPKKFSFTYMLYDNAKRILLNLLLILISLRFMTEITGWDLSVWKGFIIGISYDSLLMIVKQKTSILDPRGKIEIKDSPPQIFNNENGQPK